MAAASASSSGFTLSELERVVAAGNLDSAIATTLLHWAAKKRGSEEVLRALLRNGADVDSIVDGSSALQKAARTGLLNQCRILLQHGANAHNAAGTTAECRRILSIWENLDDFGKACATGDDSQLSLARVDARGSGKSARIGFYVAAEFGQAHIVEHLLQGHNCHQRANFAKVIWPGTSGQETREAPLHAAARGGSLETIKLLISYGADITAKDEHGCTPGQYAKRFGHTHCLKTLGVKTSVKQKEKEEELATTSVKQKEDLPTISVKTDNPGIVLMTEEREKLKAVLDSAIRTKIRLETLEEERHRDLTVIGAKRREALTTVERITKEIEALQVQKEKASAEADSLSQSMALRDQKYAFDLSEAKKDPGLRTGGEIQLLQQLVGSASSLTPVQVEKRENELWCCVCLDLPAGNISCCQECEQVVCKDCVDKLKDSCPMCRADLSKNPLRRSKLAERLVAALKK